MDQQDKVLPQMRRSIQTQILIETVDSNKHSLYFQIFYNPLLSTFTHSIIKLKHRVLFKYRFQIKHPFQLTISAIRQ